MGNLRLIKHSTTRKGCDHCLGAVTIDGDSVTRNSAYFVIAHASKFMNPNSIRIDSNLFDGLQTVAFIRPGGERELIALNDAKNPISFQIADKKKFSMPN